jgi:15-cis-phytoene synthase
MPARPEWPAARALAWLYTPAPQQALFAALCDLEREIAASLRSGLDHQVAHLRLGWWRDECARSARGQPSHPLTRALTACLPGGAAPAELAGLVDTAQWDLAAATFQTRRELAAYCERWSGAFLEPLTRAALPGSPAGTGRALGSALRESELLGALARDARAGRLRLPLDELARAGVAPESLARPPWSAALAQLIGARHRELRRALAAGADALEQPALRGLLVWAALACEYSRRAARALPAASASLERAALDGWRAWRSARRAAAGRLRLKVD